MAQKKVMDNLLAPYHALRFHLDFKETTLGATGTSKDVVLCSGSFAECSGLEATMETKVIKAGGHNYGAAQRVGQTTFATVVLKRGMTRLKDLWGWYEMVSTGKYAHRVNVDITMFDNAGKGVMTWQLLNALPVKFKASDLNAKSGDVAIEEIHLVHEGLTLASPTVKSLFAQGGSA